MARLAINLKVFVSYQGTQIRIPVFLAGVNLALLRFLRKMTVLQSPIFHISPTGNKKIDHTWIEYDHILLFTNHKSTLL